MEKSETLSPLYSVPNGYECETIYGLFVSVAKWKVMARAELASFLEENRKAQNEPD